MKSFIIWSMKPENIVNKLTISKLYDDHDGSGSNQKYIK